MGFKKNLLFLLFFPVFSLDLFAPRFGELAPKVGVRVRRYHLRPLCVVIPEKEPAPPSTLSGSSVEVSPTFSTSSDIFSLTSVGGSARESAVAEAIEEPSVAYSIAFDVHFTPEAYEAEMLKVIPSLKKFARLLLDFKEFLTGLFRKKLLAEDDRIIKFGPKYEFYYEKYDLCVFRAMALGIRYREDPVVPLNLRGGGSCGADSLSELKCLMCPQGVIKRNDCCSVCGARRICLSGPYLPLSQREKNGLLASISRDSSLGIQSVWLLLRDLKILFSA